MRLLLRRQPIPFQAFGALRLGRKELAFYTLNPTFSGRAVFQFYNLDTKLGFKYSYKDLEVSRLPQPVPNPLPVYGDWVRLRIRRTSFEYLLASSSTGPLLYPWLSRMINKY